MATGDLMIVSMSDELIMAFADGELDPFVAARVKAAISNDDTIRRKHEMYLHTRSVIARSFGNILGEPVPERLKRTVRGSVRRTG